MKDNFFTQVLLCLSIWLINSAIAAKTVYAQRRLIFGETPSAKFPLHGQTIADDSGNGGTFHSTTHCIVEGVAVQYDWISERDLITKIQFMPENSCRSS